MKLINIKSFVGSHAVSKQQGDLVYGEILKDIDNGGVYLSFRDIKTTSPEFLYSAIGKLVSKHSEDYVKSNVHIIDAENKYLYDMINAVIASSVEYFKNNV